MHTVTPTNLREHFFGELDAVPHGVPVRVDTKHGSAVIISAGTCQQRSLTESQAVEPGKPKIQGRIDGNLDDADKEMESYLELLL